SGVLSQVTNLYTGVSGITNLSPALSTASHSPRVVFSAYEDGKYNIYAVDDPERLAGHEPNRSTAAASPALLPPQDRGQEAIPQLLADADTGLPPVRPIPPEGYRAKLTLDYVGAPTVGAGRDAFGTYVGGSSALYFSDMMGEHSLLTAVQV